jgi:hypothetical protein
MKEQDERLREAAEIYKVLKSFGVFQNEKCASKLTKYSNSFVKDGIGYSFKLAADENTVFSVTFSLTTRSGVHLLTPMRPKF